AKQAIYHERDNYRTLLDVNDSAEALLLADEERLAEDLRLLYVALTRAVYHCSIGLAALTIGNKKSANSDLHHSAIGYLLQQQQAADYHTLYEAMNHIEGSTVYEVTTPIP